jgi:hypothetical protein
MQPAEVIRNETDAVFVSFMPFPPVGVLGRW